MVHKISEIMKKANAETETVFAVCGIEHMAYRFGVPKGIWA